MTHSDRKRLALCVGALGEAYRQPVTEATIRAYEMGLDDVPIATLEHAAKRALRERKFMPTVAELRELAGEQTPADRAVIAWTAALNAHAVHGYYGSVCFDDPAVNATIRAMGGWERFDERLEAEGRTWLGKEFDRIYQAYCRRGVTRSEGAALGGYHNRMNHGRFDAHVPQPVEIRTTLKPTPLLTHEPTGQAELPVEVAGYLENVGATPE